MLIILRIHQKAEMSTTLSFQRNSKHPQSKQIDLIKENDNLRQQTSMLKQNKKANRKSYATDKLNSKSNV